MLHIVIKYKYLILFFSFSGFVACKKSFLDVDNNSQLYRQSYVKDLNTMEQFMNGIYVLLNNNYEHGIGAAYPDLIADNLKPLSSGTQSLFLHYSWSQQPSEKQEFRPAESSINMNGSWILGYQIIRACNFVIEDVDKYRSENPDKADDIKGQAYAIRAMVHFKLVNIFAQSYKFTQDASHPGIPYITTSDISDNYSRQTVSEVYDRMITDLNKAVELLPSAITDTRYMNVAASKGLLARLYLFKEDYGNAKDVAKEISSQFPLLTIGQGYPNDLFKNKLPTESEILFRLTPMNLSGNVSLYLGRFLRASALRYTATTDIATILNEYPSDIRNSWVTNNSGLWNVTKYPTAATPEITPAITLPETAYYPSVIRCSEMYLTVAEAAAKTNDENTARTYLEAIRKRANPSVADIKATGQALLDSIYKERRKELAFEGLRIFDLQRWKLGVQRVDALSGAPVNLKFPNDKSIAPIPLLDVKIEGLLQNDSY